MKKITLTRPGYEKLKKELDHLMTKKRREIAKDLERARAFGDLKENAEYDSAKNNQAMNEKRIHELQERLHAAQILDDSKIAKDKVLLGAKVTVKDMKLNETFVYTMVASEEADFNENKISVSSPIGKSLLGHKQNETIEIKVPAGTLQYKIIKIER